MMLYRRRTGSRPGPGGVGGDGVYVFVVCGGGGGGVHRLQAALIGAGFGTGLAVVATSPKHFGWGLYVSALSFFHISEYVMTSLYNADTVNWRAKSTHCINCFPQPHTTHTTHTPHHTHVTP